MGKGLVEDLDWTDLWNEILLKAQKGQELTDTELARKAGVKIEDLRKLKNGVLNEKALFLVAQALSLSGEILLSMATGKCNPQPLSLPFFLKKISIEETPEKKSYLLIDKKTNKTFLIDPPNKQLIENYVNDREYGLDHVFLFSLEQIQELADVLKSFSLACSAPSKEGQLVRKEEWFGSFKVELIPLIDKIFYFVHPPESPPLVFVGKYFISGSISYEETGYYKTLELIRSTLFGFPDETIICPRIGPLSTVGFEKGHNPFFPEYQIYSSFQLLTEI
ncbi:hypothetical protein A946_08865 [Methylacidiphilum kamchatkense Kam1]|uniref:Uncharacterized protein n=1 Tax=Methylacidiphilum kamchatkense Kam1 TaxID=1202785 RepID=A0A0C1UQX1_9BACT|nr:hypothetical protein [Methylacidiphilum kamchatkense]KIE58263.1 hypothetical protein A946_08865 [Methylacidiphilum kamchatkense Kam1]QDQ42022.1 hypothetical protein kam1_778 [Methylacidiphilum kamchatkense Kam1]